MIFYVRKSKFSMYDRKHRKQRVEDDFDQKSHNVHIFQKPLSHIVISPLPDCTLMWWGVHTKEKVIRTYYIEYGK